MSYENASGVAAVAPRGALAGIVIAVCAGLSVIAIASHPTVVVERSSDAALAAIIRFAPIDRLVHGAFIAIMGALEFAFFIFSARLGFRHATALAGFVAFTIGIGAMISTGLIDGFLITDTAARFAGGSPENTKIAIDLLTMCALMIQVLGKLGVIGISIGIVGWSICLMGTPGILRAVGVLGTVAGLLPASLVLIPGVQLTPHSLGGIIVLQAIWYFAIAALLLREKL